MNEKSQMNGNFVIEKKFQNDRAVFPIFYWWTINCKSIFVEPRMLGAKFTKEFDALFVEMKIKLWFLIQPSIFASNVKSSASYLALKKRSILVKMNFSGTSICIKVVIKLQKNYP